MDERRGRLRKAARALAERRARLGDLLERKEHLRRSTDAQIRAQARRTRSLARQTKSLRELLRRLETARREDERKAAAARRAAASVPPPPPPGRPFSQARGRLPFPVVGRIVGRYGQTTETGMTRKGIVIETGAGAQVVAPYDGRIVFAGKFRGYGQLLIIEHGGGYHSLLAGLARLDGTMDHRVLTGEPVGVMGRPGGRNPSLYMELRRNGQPINPLPWLAVQRGKVSG